MFVFDWAILAAKLVEFFLSDFSSKAYTAVSTVYKKFSHSSNVQSEPF